MRTSWLSRRRSPVVVAGLVAAMIGTATKHLEAQELDPPSQQRGFKVDHLEPAESGSAFLTIDGADFRGRRGLAVSALGTGAYQPIPGEGRSVLRSQVNVYACASLALLDRLRVSLAVPVLLRSEGQSNELGGAMQSAPSETAGVGDLRFGGDLRIASHASGAASLAAGLQIFLPTGDRDKFTSDGQPRFAPRVLFGGIHDSLVYGVKLGAMLRTRDEAWGDSRVGSSIVSSAGFGYRSDDGRVMVGPEILMSTVFTGGEAFERRTTPIELLFGAHMDIARGLRLALGGGIGLTRGYGAPRLRGLLSVEWTGELPTRSAGTVPRR